MDTYELLEELSQKSRHEIEFCLTALILRDKLDFVSVSNAYTQALKEINDDQLNKLIEAETCVMQGFLHKMGGKKESDQLATQRSLYLLNKSRRFQMQSLNKQYSYDEEIGKTASWYERNKKHF